MAAVSGAGCRSWCQTERHADPLYQVHVSRPHRAEDTSVCLVQEPSWAEAQVLVQHDGQPAADGLLLHLRRARDLASLLAWLGHPELAASIVAAVELGGAE